VGDPAAWTRVLAALEAVRVAARPRGARTVVVVVQPPGEPPAELPEERLGPICRQGALAARRPPPPPPPPPLREARRRARHEAVRDWAPARQARSRLFKKQRLACRACLLIRVWQALELARSPCAV